MRAPKSWLALACSASVAAVVVSPLAAQSPLASSMSVAVSPARTGADPATVTLQLDYEMQCGYPGPGPVVVRFPSAERLPKVFSTSAVLVDGSHEPAAREAGNAVSVTLPPAPAIMCDVIGPGRLTIVFGRSAGLGNPARAGSYAISVSRQAAAFSARFTLHGG